VITFDHSDHRNRKFSVDYGFECNDLYGQFQLNAKKQPLTQKNNPAEMTKAEKALHVMRCINAKLG
jgi:hypothetical protein